MYTQNRVTQNNPHFNSNIYTHLSAHVQADSHWSLNFNLSVYNVLIFFLCQGQMLIVTVI